MRQPTHLLAHLPSPALSFLALQAAPDAVYPGALQTFESLGRVVESLQARTAKLTAGA